LKLVYDKVEDEYTVLTPYIDALSHVQMRHNCEECNNNEFPITPAHFLDKSRGRRCPICSQTISIRKRTRTQEKFEKEIYDLVGEEYSVVGNYTKAKDKIEIRHNKCLDGKSHQWSLTPDNFLSKGERCPKCAEILRRQKRTKEHDKYVQEVFELVGKEYTVESEYTNAKTYIQIHHALCHSTYPIIPDSFLSGTRCPICMESSKGEKRLDVNLVKNNWIKLNQKEFEKLSENDKFNIKYFIPQKKFKGLVGLKGGLLSYDFYLHKYNLLIEFQGEQHEKFIKRFHKTEEGFQKQLEHDRRKRQYCLDNNINLLEIWYYDIKITEQILESKLQELSNFQQDSSCLIAK